MNAGQNTKTASTTWFGTLNNPDRQPQEELEAMHNMAKAVYTVGQLEKGENGTEHIQFYINVGNSKQRLSYMKKVNERAHWEPVKFDKAAQRYVMKEDTRVAGPWEFGQKPIIKQEVGAIKLKQAQRAELNAQIEEVGTVAAMRQGLISFKDVKAVEQSRQIVQLLEQQPMNMPEERGIWIWGKPRVGKSWLARNAWGEDNQPYVKAQNKWWDGYQGQENVLIEDMDHKGDGLGHLLKLWADSYAFTGEVKGAQVPLNYRRLIITSNYSIEDIFGPDPEEQMTSKKRNALQEQADAISARFKVIKLNSRDDQQYWMEHIHELRKKQQIPVLQQEEVKNDRPRAHLHMIPAIDRKQNVPTWKKDFSTKQQPLLLGKRQAESSPYQSDSDMPSDSIQSDEIVNL